MRVIVNVLSRPCRAPSSQGRLGYGKWCSFLQGERARLGSPPNPLPLLAHTCAWEPAEAEP